MEQSMEVLKCNKRLFIPAGILVVIAAAFACTELFFIGMLAAGGIFWLARYA